ncbi:uncharacterized protein EDB91DRAFT_1142248, partial [Suillus paluster]|uniref:uncharacterized protein n=1 Tax=Suillus paluster TaxID=48578 RepID=UPI001B87F64D
MDGVKAAKRCKITDKSLDWMMNQKKVEVQDVLARNPTTTCTLRLFLSYTVSGQAWQTGKAAEGVNFKTGQQDQPMKVRFIIYLEQTPERYKVAPDLGNVLGIKEESRVGIIQAIIHADDYLRPICGGEGIMFHQQPEPVNRYLMPPGPVIIHYSINPARIPPEHHSAWDIEIKMEDTNLKNPIMVMMQSSKDSMSDLTKLDDEITLLAQSLHNSHMKQQFLQSFANDPANFIQTWLASQSRDLESVLGSGLSEGATIHAEELHRSDFFRLPWVEEAVAVYEGM